MYEDALEAIGVLAIIALVGWSLVLFKALRVERKKVHTYTRSGFALTLFRDGFIFFGLVSGFLLVISYGFFAFALIPFLVIGGAVSVMYAGLGALMYPRRHNKLVIVVTLAVFGLPILISGAVISYQRELHTRALIAEDRAYLKSDLALQAGQSHQFTEDDIIVRINQIGGTLYSQNITGTVEAGDAIYQFGFAPTSKEVLLRTNIGDVYLKLCATGYDLTGGTRTAYLMFGKGSERPECP